MTRFKRPSIRPLATVFTPFGFSGASSAEAIFEPDMKGDVQRRTGRLSAVLNSLAEGGVKAMSVAASITGISISSTAAIRRPSTVTKARPLNNSRSKTKIDRSNSPATKVALTTGKVFG